MINKETLVGNVQDVNGTTVRLVIADESLTGFIYIDGQGYRIGQIGSFIRIPIGFIDLFGIICQVGASAVPDSQQDNNPYGNRWMTIQLIGECQRNSTFQRGISQYPTIGDEVHIVSEKELQRIYGNPDKPFYISVGHVANAESIPALIDINKLITRHSAVVGTTGSGKSTTVATLINSLSDKDKYPSARILVLDIHGEYGNALQDRANIYKINSDSSSKLITHELYIPFWALSFDELCKVSFGEFNDEKDRNYVMERVLECKRDTLKKYKRKGALIDSLSVDSPIPFSLNHLWHRLCAETFGTYYKEKGGKPLDNLAYELDSNKNLMFGDPDKGIPPTFKNTCTEAKQEKIFWLPDSPNIAKQLSLLGSKLRIPRYDFIFKPIPWQPQKDGKTKEDLDSLLKNWIGSDKPVTILDLSGVPSDILQAIIGAVFRILYEALFWSRDLSQGGRNRPLLLVMEEAHTYLNNLNNDMASSVVQRIVKEGRKYGIGAMIVSQRPSEINPTILSQCGTIFALRLSNSTDRGHVTGALADNLESLTSMLPALRTGEAIIIGESVKLPMRTLVDAPPPNRRPDSQDPIVYDELPMDDSLVVGGWGIEMEPNPHYDEVVETWRAQNPKIKRLVKEKKK